MSEKWINPKQLLLGLDSVRLYEKSEVYVSEDLWEKLKLYSQQFGEGHFVELEEAYIKLLYASRKYIGFCPGAVFFRASIGGEVLNLQGVQQFIGKRVIFLISFQDEVVVVCPKVEVAPAATVPDEAAKPMLLQPPQRPASHRKFRPLAKKRA